MKALILGAAAHLDGHVKKFAEKLVLSGLDVLPIEYIDYDDAENFAESHKKRLNDIKSADIILIFTHDGYVSKITALEVGYAISMGVPVFSSKKLDDPFFSKIIRHVGIEEILVAETI